MKKHGRLVLAILLIGAVVWFSLELKYVDRHGEENLLEYVLGNANASLPAWEIAFVQMINKIAPGAFCIFAFVLGVDLVNRRKEDE